MTSSTKRVKVIDYTATNNANRGVQDVLQEIRTGLDRGSDGVMLGEVPLFNSDMQLDYYKKIYDYTKSFGREILVIANPGSVFVNERIMSVADIVLFEHQWRLASQVDWFSKYPATRFMGISSNDVNNVMGYTVNKEACARDTIETWKSGIGYHFSTDNYTNLAPWFEKYQKVLEEYSNLNTDFGELRIKTVDKENSEIKGLWIEVRKNDRVVSTRFSPSKFLLPEGTYEVRASSYQRFVFERWQDGEKSPYHSVTVGNNTKLIAVYRSELANLRIESYDNLGHRVKGMHVTVSSDNEIVSQGITQMNLRLPNGQYYIAASNGLYYLFNRWDDGTPVKEINLVLDAEVAAYFDNIRSDKIGPNIFSFKDYRQQWPA